MAMSEDKDITLEAATAVKALFHQGADRETRLPMLQKLSKSGNVYWTVPGQRGMFGLAVRPPKGFTDLPDRVRLESLNHVTVGDEYIQLTRDVTEDGRPKVTGSKVVTVPGQEGEVKRLLQVTISLRQDFTWNVKCSAIGLGGGAEAVSLFE
jgi:hypothetical protein